jgi:hypothetical protein
MDGAERVKVKTLLPVTGWVWTVMVLEVSPGQKRRSPAIGP